MLKVKPELIRDELDQIADILAKTRQDVDVVPGDEMPAQDMNVEIFEFRLKGSLLLMAERLSALVEAME